MEEELPDFTDEDAIRAWLEAQSPQVCACFASRAALRTLPAILIEWSRIHENPAGPELVFAILRATLTSSVAVQPAALESKDRDGMHAALSSAATAAAGSHYAAADTAAIAARSALGGFSAAHAAARAIFESAHTTVHDPTKAMLFSLNADAFELTHSSHPETVFSCPLWWNMYTPNEWAEAIMAFEISKDPAWRWWSKWYRQMFDGVFEDWALAEEIALLPDNDWDQGPAHIAGKIEIIEARHKADNPDNPAPTIPDIDDQINALSSKAKFAMQQRVTLNRDALAVSSAGVIEQIAEFKERVRGSNQLDPDFRGGLFDFLDELTQRLEELLSSLPRDGEETSDNQAGRLVLWLQKFMPLLKTNCAKYAAPENVAEAVVPTGIILVCTGIGSMLGAPTAGAVVGGLITGQIKPGKAAGELLNSETPAKPDAE